MIQDKLIKRHGLHQYTTRGIRQSDQIEITLKQAILTWGAMNGNIGIIKKTRLAILDKREIIAVDLSRGAIR